MWVWCGLGVQWSIWWRTLFFTLQFHIALAGNVTNPSEFSNICINSKSMVFRARHLDGLVLPNGKKSDNSLWWRKLTRTTNITRGAPGSVMGPNLLYILLNVLRDSLQSPFVCLQRILLFIWWFITGGHCKASEWSRHTTWMGEGVGYGIQSS